MRSRYGVAILVRMYAVGLDALAIHARPVKTLRAHAGRRTRIVERQDLLITVAGEAALLGADLTQLLLPMPCPQLRLLPARRNRRPTILPKMFQNRLRPPRLHQTDFQLHQQSLPLQQQLFPRSALLHLLHRQLFLRFEQPSQVSPLRPWNPASLPSRVKQNASPWPAPTRTPFWATNLLTAPALSIWDLAEWPSISPVPKPFQTPFLRSA